MPVLFQAGEKNGKALCGNGGLFLSRQFKFGESGTGIEMLVMLARRVNQKNLKKILHWKEGLINYASAFKRGRKPF
jgi:hypothetical protein